MKNFDLLGINLKIVNPQSILEQIIHWASQREQFAHVVSINPEIIVQAQVDSEYKKILNQAQIQLVDGVGVVAAAYIFYGQSLFRLSGVDAMTRLMNLAGEMGLCVGLLGGKTNVADKIADCYTHKYPKAHYFGLQGFEDVNNQNVAERKQVEDTLKKFQPHILFVSFGSPAQEKWIEQNKRLLQNTVCIGVGGAFDFLAGAVPRAPAPLRKLGLEWLWRLIQQPWRWRRQLRLIHFVLLLLRQKIFW